MPITTESLTVIVPCKNEEHGVVPTVEAIHALAPTLPLPVSVLMVDDGSSDSTRVRMEELAARFPRTDIMVNERNLGLGRSVINAWQRIPAGNWVTVFPGDNEMRFEVIRAHLAVREKFDVVLGYLANPVVRTMPRRVASASFTQVTRLLYGYSYRYLNGIKLYRVEAFRGIEVISGGHAFTAELLAKALLRNPNLRIGEVPFVWHGRANGSSKAIRPLSVLRAVREVAAGYRSVAEYRERAIRGQLPPQEGAEPGYE
jgi:glycosyltransferase involved in cell wall biosynthesis